MSLIKECYVYYDREAYFSYNHITGNEDKPNPKYRLFVRKVAGIFVFFYLTSKEWTCKNYIEIKSSDWIRKHKKHLNGCSRIDLNDCCKLKKGNIWYKMKKNKMYFVGEVAVDVVDRIRIAYESHSYIVPRRPSMQNVPIEFAFETNVVVTEIGKKLGIF
jgi:hypothetical protein